MVVNCLAAFFTGFVLGYIRSWRLALAISLSVLPAFTITGLVLNKFLSKCTQLSLQHVADSGTLTEEAISTIRTAQAFGIQPALANIYNTHVERSKKIDTQSAILQGAGMAVVFFIIYAVYGLAFSFGTTLINEGHG